MRASKRSVVTVLSQLWRALRTVTSSPHRSTVNPTDADALRGRVAALETHVKALYDHVQLLERDETRRAAEHATMVDQLDRLYKRVSARISRSHGGDEPNGETPLSLRRRLGR